jgi:hypothetical protein
MVDVHGGNDSAVELAWWDPDVLTEANIVPATGRATDYLNVFNEAVIPSCIDHNPCAHLRRPMVMMCHG